MGNLRLRAMGGYLWLWAMSLWAIGGMGNGGYGLWGIGLGWGKSTQTIIKTKVFGERVEQRRHPPTPHAHKIPDATVDKERQSQTKYKRPMAQPPTDPSPN